jgi:hypothetical protein
MPAYAQHTSVAWRAVAAGTLDSEQRTCLADLVDVLDQCYSDLPAEAQSAYRRVVGQLR